MVFRFRCPDCLELLSTTEDMTGACIHCPLCNVLLEVPRPAWPKIKQPAEEPAVSTRQSLVAREAPIEFRSIPKVRQDDLDMTPMVDVTFLLLIFFMVTAAFSVQKSFQIPAPDQTQPSTQSRTFEDYEEDPEYVLVHVDAYDTYRISCSAWQQQQETPDPHVLVVKLREARLGGPSGIVPTRMLVMANEQSHHETVVAALDAGHAVGMAEVNLVTVTEDD